jgi:peroxin-6
MGLQVNCYDLIENTEVKTEGTLRARFEQAASCSPCLFVLRHVDALVQTTQMLAPGNGPFQTCPSLPDDLTMLRLEPALLNVLRDCIGDCKTSWRVTGFPVVTIGTCSEFGQLPVAIKSCFSHEVVFEASRPASLHVPVLTDQS